MCLQSSFCIFLSFPCENLFEKRFYFSAFIEPSNIAVKIINIILKKSKFTLCTYDKFQKLIIESLHLIILQKRKKCYINILKATHLANLINVSFMNYKSFHELSPLTFFFFLLFRRHFLIVFYFQDNLTQNLNLIEILQLCFFL